jgi:hypothetical protein
MVALQKAWKGIAPDTFTGAVKLYMAGLPAHLEPSAARLSPGSDVSGEQRVKELEYVFVQDLPKLTFSAISDGGGFAGALEVCDGDPTVSSNWLPVGSLSADGIEFYEGTHRFARVTVTDADGGAVVYLSGTNA